METTFLMLKPDCVQRSLIGKIITRIERKGLKICAIKMVVLDKEWAERIYDIHVGKDFFEGLMEFVTSGPVVVMVIKGVKAIEVVRKLVGITNSAEAEPGTIRGDYGMITKKNIVHASDSVERVKYEIPLFFKEEEIVSYYRIDYNWVYES